MRQSRPSWIRTSFAIGITFAALACSENPASEPEGSFASRVDSAPPTAELGVLRSPNDASARNRRAREAFDRWAPLLASGAVDRARILCEAWLGQLDEGQYGEAHKCLANVEIASSRFQPSREDSSAAPFRSGIPRARSDAAVDHYDAAIAEMPFDSDAHIGRVDILILSGRYREANLALDKSLEYFSSRVLLDKWFRLLGRFQRAGDVDEGLTFLKIIEKHHPLDHRVVSNLGAYYAMAGNEEEALLYSERAVTINPDDPINRWNLARIYDRVGRLAEADRHYLEALAVFGDQDPKARCDYAGFIGTRLGDAEKACHYAFANCRKMFDEQCDGASETGQAPRNAAPDPAAG